VQLATKFGIDRSAGDAHRVVHGEHDYVKRSAEASLLRLGVDHIDLYYLHRPPQTAEIEETVDAVAALHAVGLVLVTIAVAGALGALALPAVRNLALDRASATRAGGAARRRARPGR
jgi:aryl-alcohol dehydrogenase-like predicted oxidoreductase